MVMTNSTYDGLCYNVDAHQGSRSATRSRCCTSTRPGTPTRTSTSSTTAIHAISSAHPARSPHAITFATQSTHKLLAAFSQASMIHVQNAETSRLDMARFNDAFMMHTSTSPQYGIIASCDVAAAMMEQPAGRALVQETIDEALSFRRAMAGGASSSSKGSWWFEVWQPDAMADEAPSDDQATWAAAPGRRLARLRGPRREPRAWSTRSRSPSSRPGLTADGAMQEHGIPAAVVTKFLSSRRIEIEKTGLYSFLVLFSMGITKGKWSTLVTELINFKDLYDANAPLDRVPAGAGRGASRGLRRRGAEGSVRPRSTQVYREDKVPEGAAGDVHRCCPRWRCGRRTPTTGSSGAGSRASRSTHLMGRTLAVMVVPYPPGIPLIMPGERITPATKSIHDYLLYARDFDRKFPGFETDIHGLRFAPDDGEQALPRRLRRRGGRAMIPRDIKAPTVADPVPQAAQGRGDRRRDRSADEGAPGPDRGARASRSRCATASTGTSPRTPRSAPTSRWSTASASRRPANSCDRCGRSASARRSGRWPTPTASPTSAVLGLTGRGRRLRLSRAADAGLLRQADRREPGELRQDAAAALLRRADGLRQRGEHRLRLPGPPGRPVLSEVASRAALLQVLRREHLPQRPLQRRRRPRRPPDPRGAGRGGAEACGAGLRRRPDLLRPERHQHLEQGRDERRAADAATSSSSTATTTSPCTRARWSRPAPSRSSCRRRATRSA